MKNAYQLTNVDELLLVLNETTESEYAVQPLGTFAGTIYKTLYRANGKFVPSDTGDQLAADGLKYCRLHASMPATQLRIKSSQS